MTKEELAAKLSGREYRDEITKEEIEDAKSAGLVVVYGANDDLMEFDGAISDEVDCYNGGVAHLKNGRLLQNKCGDPECPYFEVLLKTAIPLHAIWNRDGYSWIYETEIPHATFDIFENGERYCRGIVFHVEDVKERAHA